MHSQQPRVAGVYFIFMCKRSQNQYACLGTEAGFTSDDILANQQQQYAGIFTCAPLCLRSVSRLSSIHVLARVECRVGRGCPSVR